MIKDCFQKNRQGSRADYAVSSSFVKNKWGPD